MQTTKNLDALQRWSIGRISIRFSRVTAYTHAVTSAGLLILVFAIRHFSIIPNGLWLFILLGVISELTSIHLFTNSRSTVSMSSIIAVASIAAFGPLAGIFTYVASGLTTAITTTLQGEKSIRGKTPVLKRTAFNVGMWVIAGFAGGQVFMLLGGIPGVIENLAIIPALAAAAVVEWLVNAILLIGVISLQTGRSVMEIWKRDISWQAPVSIIGGILGGGILVLAYGKLHIFGILIVLLPILSTSYAFRAYKHNMQEYVDGLEGLNLDLKNALSALEKSNADLTEANNSVRRLNAELFHSLAKVFDMRDPYVGGHAAQVSVYAVAIATEMHLPAERIELIRQAAYLHDIGKLAIPEVILHKAGKLTSIEYEFIKKHSDIGGELLVSTQGLKHLAPFVRHHHERWDGGGYPMGLVGEEIPLEARILNVCDSVESMASDRPYHRGMSVKAIVAEVQRCSGTQFDPLVAETFVHLALQDRQDQFIINSARSVTQQYAATILASESLTQSMFAWVLDREDHK
jgi:putative nucleotidyltransferase with HDIG domain